MTDAQAFEFRPANDNEMAEFRRVESYVFASPPQQDAPPSPLRPEWTQCAFAGEEMAAVSGAYPFVVRLNGNTAQVHGVTAVGTEPRFRRRGLVRRLVTDLLHRAKDEGCVGSMLLASMGAIYQRFGYGLGSYNVFYRFDPRMAEFEQRIEPRGECRRMSKDEAIEYVRAVYKSYEADRNLTALRSQPVWDRLFQQVAKSQAHCVVHFDDEANADAYCLYSTKWVDRIDGHPPQELVISDFAYADENGYRGIWQHLLAHDLVGTVVWNNLPEDDPAPGMLLEPRCLNRRTLDGLWFRVVDARGMLQARGYDVDGSVTLAVEHDRLCPWNNGRWTLAVSGGEAEVLAGKNREADLICSVNGLASLATGFASASWLERTGRVKVNDRARLGAIDALFATRHRPSMSFGF